MNDYKELFDELKKYNEEEYLDKFIELIKKILLERTSFVKNSTNDSKREEFFSTLKTMFKEIFNNNMSKSIEYIGCGHTSLAFKIGDNVLKIGKINNNHYKTPDFACTIPILLDKNFKVDEKEYYTIQLSPYVDTKDISEEELYETYKKLRALGYIWNDPTFENVGRITSDINTEKYSYKKGDIVIIDLEDFAYVGEDTPDYILDEIAIASYNSRTYKYETRYLEEKGKSL